MARRRLQAASNPFGGGPLVLVPFAEWQRLTQAPALAEANGHEAIEPTTPIGKPETVKQRRRREKRERQIAILERKMARLTGAASKPAPAASDEAPKLVTVGERQIPGGRGFKRARYFVQRQFNPAGLAETRAKVYKAIRSAGDAGLTARQLQRLCRLTHGSVQQTLNWLRGQRLVMAAESELG